MDSIYKTPVRLIPPFTARVVVRILSEIQDYNLQMMNIPAMWKDTMGEAVRLVVLDTGLPAHSDLDPVGSKSFIDGYLEDKNGHGTHVGGIIAAIANNGMGVAGIAPKCEDWYGAVMNGDGSGTTESIINGIRWAVDVVGAKVINMSLGMPGGFPIMRDLEAACNYAVGQGCAVVAAAGNEGGAVGQPACYDSVIAVADVNSKKEHAAFSDFGPEIDFAAGGVDVYSTFLNNGYAKLSGTSMASPAIAGVVALILADEYKDTGKWLTPAEVVAKLKKIAFDVTPVGFDEFVGSGIPIFRTGAGEPDEPETAPVPDPSQPVNPPVPPKPTNPGNGGGIVSPCNLALPLLRQFVEAAGKAMDEGKTEQEAIGMGIRRLQDFLQRVDKAQTRRVVFQGRQGGVGA